MTRYKHVLVLIILILPMFALVPALVTGPNEVLSNRAPVDTALPAQFVEETLRVAVYAEDNTSLPSYATGGVYTDHYANVISLLDSAGYAVTALTTQDILDHKLKVVDFDVFVLPNNGPKDEIVELVVDFWIGGGGVLNFDNSVGFCFYGGLIDPIYEGNDQGGIMWDVIGSDLWPNMTITTRNPVTKVYTVGDWYLQSGVLTIFNPAMIATIGPRYVPLAVTNHTPTSYMIFGLDNPDRGGRFVHFPGNCSDIPAWQNQMIIDAIDWLTPRPKGRILFDLTHLAAYGVDPWDANEWGFEFYYIWRDALVGRGYTFDKLQPSAAGNLTSSNLEDYDMLVLPMSAYNYTNSEISDVTSWVSNGGGLLVFGDQTYALDDKQEQNRMLGAFDLWNNYTVALDNTIDGSEIHPLNEYCATLTFAGPGALNHSGAAYPIRTDINGRTAVAGQEYGEGRVILTGDLDFLGHNQIGLADNWQFGVNVANWLTAATARVLVYADSSTNPLHPNIVPEKGPVALALNDLGEPFFLTSDIDFFNISLFRDSWDLIVFDNNNYFTNTFQPHLIDFVESGGKVVFNTWFLDPATGDYFGVDLNGTIGSPPDMFLWEPDHPIFNFPVDYGASTMNTTLDLSFGTDAMNYTTYANATPLAGYSGSGVAIALGAGGNVIVNGPLLASYTDDTDDSTYPDNLEMWINQIGFLYYDRPMIDHPADVTYMQTETGNEITWTPTADAGPMDYTFYVNGTPVESGPWDGSALTFNIDGVNISITEYELEVFDRLGYGVSDLVILNVTEYIEPPGPGIPVDLTLLLIIGGAIAVVVVILIVVMKKKK